jgi:hypothetical protein
MDELDMIKIFLSWLGIFLMLGPMIFNPTHLNQVLLGTFGKDFFSDASPMVFNPTHPNQVKNSNC